MPTSKKELLVINGGGIAGDIGYGIGYAVGFVGALLIWPAAAFIAAYS